MARKQYNHVVVVKGDKVVLRTNDLREARRACWKRHHSECAQIIHSQSFLKTMDDLRPDRGTFYANKDAFNSPSVQGLVACMTVIPARGTGAIHESLSFVPPVCYRHFPPNERSILHEIERTFC